MKRECVIDFANEDDFIPVSGAASTYLSNGYKISFIPEDGTGLYDGVPRISNGVMTVLSPGSGTNSFQITLGFKPGFIVYELSMDENPAAGDDWAIVHSVNRIDPTTYTHYSHPSFYGGKTIWRVQNGTSIVKWGDRDTSQTDPTINEALETPLVFGKHYIVSAEFNGNQTTVKGYDGVERTAYEDDADITNGQYLSVQMDVNVDGPEHGPVYIHKMSVYPATRISPPPSGITSTIPAKTSVLTYNVGLLPGSEVSDQATVGALIKSIGADIVCCQEAVDPAAIASAAGYAYYYFTASQNGWGNMIMSNYPLTNKITINLTDFGGTLRNAVFATVRGKTFVSTSLNGNDSEADNTQRIAHMDEINAQTIKAVICGDFNHVIGRTSYDYALTIWNDAGGDGNTTIDDKRDFIYTLNETSSYPVITDDLIASDHKPLGAEIDL